MSHLNIGILAHVDAGKTTLSEAILYHTGTTRRIGRVDNGDAYLDTNVMEKERGITIFSKQAELRLPVRIAGDAAADDEDSAASGTAVTLLDTPGHADFSPEMERTLSVLDYAVLLVSALDGISGQLPTLWKLLAFYKVPTFLFVNKMDRPGTDREKLMEEISGKFGSGCIDMDAGGVFSSCCPERKTPEDSMPVPDAVQENIAVLDEELLNDYLENGREVLLSDVRKLIRGRQLFPVLFGSALKDEGIEEFLKILTMCVRMPSYGESFGARVYKITRDEGTRLTWVKLTGGTLRAKQMLSVPMRGGEEAKEEKINEIRRYSGTKYEPVKEAKAGDIVALTGITGSWTGMGLGSLAGREGVQGLLQPILTSTILLPPGTDVYKAYRDLKALEEEEPMLHLVYDAEHGRIAAEIMGEVETEILGRLIEDRFGMRVGFGPGEILYKETIRGAVEGVGHFEPLRHYSEVHVLLEAGAPGSGIVFDNACRTDDLALNWQRLILSELENMPLRGVLTGAELMDVKITLLAGRASIKHTEGGDFREAAGRAVRQGLMMAENILLEPILSCRLTVPAETVGRALSDMSAMGAAAAIQETDGVMTTITGRVAAASLGDYAATVSSYTGGKGSLVTGFDGYEPCRNAEEIIEKSGYIAELDLGHPVSSVFCSHGVGTIIPWNEVRDYMHVDTGWRPGTGFGSTGMNVHTGDGAAVAASVDENGRITADADHVYSDEELETYAEAAAFHAKRAGEKKDERTYGEREAARCAFDSELQDIFEKTYGKIKKHSTEDDAYVYGAGLEKRKSGNGSGNASEGAGDAAGDNSPGWKTRRNRDTESRTAEAVGYGKTASGNPHRNRTAPEKEYLLVDGYNIIYAWTELRSLAATDIKAARDRLIDILMNYGGYSRAHVILVYDAYKVQGGTGEVYHLPHLDVIYTKEAETADLYIEKAAHDLSRKNYRVTVATSDSVEQVIIFGSGAMRLSAQGFEAQVKAAEKEMREKYGL